MFLEGHHLQFLQLWSLFSQCCPVTKLMSPKFMFSAVIYFLPEMYDGSKWCRFPLQSPWGRRKASSTWFGGSHWVGQDAYKYIREEGGVQNGSFLLRIHCWQCPKVSAPHRDGSPSQHIQAGWATSPSKVLSYTRLMCIVADVNIRLRRVQLI